MIRRRVSPVAQDDRSRRREEDRRGQRHLQLMASSERRTRPPPVTSHRAGRGVPAGRDAAVSEQRNTASTAPSETPPARHAYAGKHGTTPAALLLYLRRVRDLDRGLNPAWREIHMSNLKEAIADVNQTPWLFARVKSELASPHLERFGASPGRPLLVHGSSPPFVSRTALWMKPDSTFGLAFPPRAWNGEGAVEQVKPGVGGTVKRLSFLVREIQRLEAGGSNTPLPGPEQDEARDLIKFSNLAVNEGRWAAADVMRFVHMKLGQPGGLWSSERATSSKTHVHISDRTVLSLILPNQPVTTSPASYATEPSTQPQEQPSKPMTSISREKETPKEAEKRQRKDQDDEREDEIPISVPYTTAASTFLYGSNTVLAALRAGRRKAYHLYLHPRLSARESNAKAIIDLAKQHGIRTTHNADLRILDKMSEDRPHNGVVLEASRLPAPPLLSLAKPNRRTSIVPLVLDRQSAEDIAVNGAPGALPTLTRTWRHPFVLMLDGIVDPGNVGNILRTAHFYGVDAVVVATNTCASLTSAALAKASSGACEALRIFALPRPAPFIYDSRKAGWNIYAAVAPHDQRPAELRRPRDYEQNVTTSDLARSSPLARHPAILMLGAEGEGLRENLTRQANYFVTIEQKLRAFDVEENQADVGVDSLNVGVAAGVLVEAFMRKPEGAQDLGSAGELGF